MEYETYREMMNDMALKIEEQKRYIAEYEEIITEAMEYMEAYPIDQDVFCKKTGRYETPFKDLQKILGGIKGINKILEVNEWDKYINKSLELLEAPNEELWTIDSLITIIDNLNFVIERLRGE